MRNRSFNTLYVGLAAGIILPSLILLLILLARKGEYSLAGFARLGVDMGFLPKLISLCLIPNLLLFFLFIRFNLLRSARGILLSMFIAGGFILILKVV